MQKMQRLNEIQFSIDQANQQIHTNTFGIEQNIFDMENLSKEILHLGEVKKLLIRLKNNKMIEKKDFILTTINTALSDVFVDKKIRLDIEASNTTSAAGKINIKYDIVYYENDIEIGRNETLIIAIGGGVMAFISILFKILVGFLYSKNKLFIFDESLAEVSEMYRPRMAQFLQKFCEVQGFTIILITQTSDIAEYSDLSYLLDADYNSDEIVTLKIEKILGTYPEEDYYYTEIENFQSIKKLEFRYKGFTTVIGKNSIGKSASFRALNSIIYNTFDQKKYPRLAGKSKPNKVLNSKITFGKFHTKDDPQNEVTKILLERKGPSLIYTFDGLEFVGKNLAFEKVKEKIESIGFKYLNLKEQYKNFKGNLKEQTERLAITTQQDGYYLIGDKANDTAKIFDFLFDSREVTMAIQDVNNDILNLENSLNSKKIENIEFQRVIDFEKKKVEVLDLDFKILLIDLYLTEESDLYLIQKEINLLQNIKSNLDGIIEIHQFIINSSYLDSRILEISNGISNLQPKIKNYSDLIDTISKIEIINKLSFLQKSVFEISQRITFIDSYINIYNKLIYTNESMHLLENLFLASDRIEILKNNLNTSSLKLNFIDGILAVVKNIDIITGLINNINNQYSYQKNTEHTKLYNLKLIEIYDTLIKSENISKILFDYENLQKEIYQKEISKNNIFSRLENLHNEFGLVPCTTCNCTGFL